MRIVVCLCIVFSVIVLSLWAHKAMIDIRPRLRRPSPEGNTREVINDLEGHLRRHVMVLAQEIGPRHVFLPSKLKACADYIRTFWQHLEYEVTAQTFEAANISCENLSVEIPGRSEPDRIVLVGAHYDTVSLSPGANDNGSAVAALLELSRFARERTCDWTVRFVAFSNEEPPFFKTRHMGSLVYANACQRRKENIVAMICLETIGYYRQEPKTQKYPFPFSLFYPDTGDFVAVVGDLHSKPLVRSFARAFMEASDFPVECAALFTIRLPRLFRSGLPGVFCPIPGIDWSDHWSFWNRGYQAIMLTDTALFRYPHYHTPQDTADKLDYHGLARVTYGIFKALDKLAGQTVLR
jgi:Zn-dependent M28 family amino/carboxypeptidase